MRQAGALEKHVAAKHPTATETDADETATDRETAGPFVVRAKLPCDEPGCTFQARKAAALVRHKATAHAAAPSMAVETGSLACPWPSIMAGCDDEDTGTAEAMLRAERELAEHGTAGSPVCARRFADVGAVAAHLGDQHGVAFSTDDLSLWFADQSAVVL